MQEENDMVIGAPRRHPLSESNVLAVIFACALPLSILGGMVWQEAQTSSSARDALQRVTLIEAQALPTRVNAMETQLREMKMEQQRMTDLLNSINQHMQSVDDRIASMDDKIKIVVDQAFPVRGRK